SSVIADHDDVCELPEGEAGRPFILPVTTNRSNSPRRHPRIRASPGRGSQRRAAAELFVVDLIAKQDPETDSQLASRGDARLANTFLLQFPAIEAPERRVMLDGVNRRFAPEQPEQRIALLRNLAEPLTVAARVLAWDQADVAGNGLRVWKARRI